MQSYTRKQEATVAGEWRVAGVSIRLSAFGHGRAHWAPMYSMPRMEKTSTVLRAGSAVAMTMQTRRIEIRSSELIAYVSH